jgi:hypothetical protein
MSSPFNWRDQPSEAVEAIKPSAKARSNSRHVPTCLPDGGINNGQKVAVEQLTADGAVVRRFQSISSAARELGVSTTSIHQAIAGRSKTCCGHAWRYATSPIDPRAQILRDRFGGAYSKAKQGDA